MKESSLTKKRFGLLFLPIGFFIVVVISALSYSPFEAQTQNGWTTPEIISTSPVSGTVYSWFPDLAVDELNMVHVIWCSTTPLSNSQMQEQIAYTRKTITGWSKPNDIVPPSLDIVRNAITTDFNGHVLLLFRGSINGNPLTLYFTQANLDNAISAQGWSPYEQINRGSSYMSAIALDSHGVIHVIYDDIENPSKQSSQVIYSDIYYRQSADGGKTWSSPIDLSNSPDTGSARPHLVVDSSDTIHVTWDEGWDRLSGNLASTFTGGYTYSKDGGQSWSTPKIINYPANGPVQLTVGSNGKGGVMLVWRSKLEQDQNVYYQWSKDGGATWSTIATIPGIYARPWTIPFDMYNTATDSAGNIHLVMVGQLQKTDVSQGVYHLIWDGNQWSVPEKVFMQDNLFPENPKIVIAEGNQIHATWFTYEGSEYTLTNRQVWYSSSQTNAPQVIITPRPTQTIPPPTMTPTPLPSPTPRPTVSSVGIDQTSPTKEMDYLKIIAIALSPVAGLIGLVFLIKQWMRSRDR